MILLQQVVMSWIDIDIDVFNLEFLYNELAFGYVNFSFVFFFPTGQCTCEDFYAVNVQAILV